MCGYVFFIYFLVHQSSEHLTLKKFLRKTEYILKLIGVWLKKYPLICFTK